MITELNINEERKREYYAKGYWSDKTLCDVWNEQVSQFAGRVYVKDDCRGQLTYGQVDDLASRLASWLVEQGVENGDIVTFQVPKWVEFCVVYVACLKVGAVMHPLATNFNGEDITYAMNLVGTKVFICPTFFHKTNHEQQLYEVEDKIPTLKAALLIDKTDRPMPDSHYPTLAHILETYEPYTGTSQAKSDDAACILSTSGTTGRPKQVLYTHNNILFSERAYVSVLDMTPDDVCWMPSPLNHATGFFHALIATMLVGAQTILQLHYTPEGAVNIINVDHVTWSHGATPFIFDLLSYLDSTGRKIPSLRFFLCGGAPVPSTMVRRAAEYGFALCESYGSTESCPHVYVPIDKAVEWDGKFSGIPYEGIEVRVVDANHNEVPYGTQGEECSRGPNVFIEYLNDPERTAEALDDDDWFYSGDLCTMDEQHRIHINGRMKEIIIRGGENLSATEIDNGLDGCPGIGEHATIGMPDDRLGERICTFYEPIYKDQRPTVADVQAYLNKKGVQKRLWPEHLEVIDEIPHTKTGKVQRFKLQEILKERLGK